jgi:hypothetical protein
LNDNLRFRWSGREFSIEVQQLLSQELSVEVFDCALAPGGSHSISERFVLEKQCYFLGKLIRIIRLDKKSRRAIDDYLRNAIDVRSDDGLPAGHCLDRREAEAFDGCAAREHEYVTRRKKAWKHLIALRAK